MRVWICRFAYVFMKNFKVFLKAKTEGAAEKFSAPARCFEEADGRTFVFAAEGGHFRIHVGKEPYLERTGEFSYRFRLGNGRGNAVICTAYGDISVGVESVRFLQRMRGDSFFLKTNYVLFFPNFSQQHEITFFAKEVSPLQDI
mgnify:CR=1 FL=1